MRIKKMKVSVYIDQHIVAETFPIFPTSRHFHRPDRVIDSAPSSQRWPAQHYNSVIIRRELRHPDQIIASEQCCDRSRRKIAENWIGSGALLQRYHGISKLLVRTRDDPPGKPNDDEALYQRITNRPYAQKERTIRRFYR